jgi:hypothetical protein
MAWLFQAVISRCVVYVCAVAAVGVWPLAGCCACYTGSSRFRKGGLPARDLHHGLSPCWGPRLGQVVSRISLHQYSTVQYIAMDCVTAAADFAEEA